LEWAAWDGRIPGFREPGGWRAADFGDQLQRGEQGGAEGWSELLPAPE